MARLVETVQRASARRLPSELRPQYTQPPRPGTPFSIPQPSRPGTPFSVPRPEYDPSLQWGKYLTSNRDLDFAPLGNLRPTRHKFRCSKPYEDQRFKRPDSLTADSLQRLRALIKTSGSKKTLDPMKELKEIKKKEVPIPFMVPECRSKQMSRETGPCALKPATKKRLASSFLPMPEKVKRRLTLSTVLEEPVDTVAVQSSADSSADQRGLLISPHIQGSLKTSLSVQKFQRPPTCARGKIIHASSSRRGFKSLSSTKEVSSLSNLPQKDFRQGRSDQADLQLAPSDKDGFKPSLKGELSDLSFSLNGLSLTSSSQWSLTPLTAVKWDQRAASSQEDIQICSSSPTKGPMQSTSSKVSLGPDPADQGGFRTSPLNQESFKSYPPLKNGLRSSLTAQRGLNPSTTPQRSLTSLIPTQAEIKISTCTPGAQGPLPCSERALESSTHTQEVVGTCKSAQGIFLTSLNLQKDLPPSQTSPGVLSPSYFVKEGLGLSTSTEKGQRPMLPPKWRFKKSAMKRNHEHSDTSRKLIDGPFEQGDFTVSLSDQEGFNYFPVTKRALLTCQQAPKSQIYAKTLQVSHAGTTSVQGTLTIQPPQGSLEISENVREILGISTYIPDTLGHPEPVQDSLSTTLSNKGTVGQDIFTKGDLAMSTHLEMAFGCGISTKDDLRHILSVHRVLDVPLHDQWAMGRDTCTSYTSKEGDSFDSAGPQIHTGPSQTSQLAVGTSLCPQEYQQSVTTIQDVIDSSPLAQKAVNFSTCPQVSPEHLSNTPKSVNSTLSAKGSLEPVLPLQLALEPDLFIQKSLSPSSSEESVLGSSTSKQGGLINCLPSHKALGPPTYARDALEKAKPTQGALVTSPHSEATVKTCIYTQDTLTPSPFEGETLRSTISTQGALQSSPSTQEAFVNTPSQGRDIRHYPSSKVNPRHLISTKKRLRDDPSDQGDFITFPCEEDSFNILPSAKRLHAAPPESKETSIATTTPQVSSTPSISVQKCLECSTSGQETVKACPSTQGPPGHSILSQEAQGPALSAPKGLLCLPSAPGLQGHSSPLSSAPEHFSCVQSTPSLSKSKLGAKKPSLSAQGSEGKSTSAQNPVGLVPQEDLIFSISSRASKDPSSSHLLVGEHLTSSLGFAVRPESKQVGVGSTPSIYRSLRHSTSAPEILCCFQSAQGTIEPLPSTQGVRKTFASSLKYTQHLSHHPGDLKHPLLALRNLGHALPDQEPLETSSCSTGVKGSLVSLQRTMNLSPTAQSTIGIFPTTQGALGPLLSFPSEVGTFQSAQKMLKPFPPAQAALEISPSTPMALGHLPVAPEHSGLSTSSQETPLFLPHVHGDLGEFQYGSGTLSLMPSTQWQHKSPSFSEQSVTPLPSCQGAVEHSSSAQQTLELSTPTQGTLRYSLPGPGDTAQSLSSQRISRPLSSVGVDMGTYFHALASPGHFTGVLGLQGPMLSKQDPVRISLPVQKSLRHLPPAQKAVGHSLSAQRDQKVSIIEKVTTKPLETAKMALINPGSFQRTLGYIPCDQDALGHFPSSVGALKYAQTNQRTHKCLTSARAALENLPSNSKAVENSATGGLKSSLSSPKALEHEISAKEPEKLSISAPGSLGLSLPTQEEALEHLPPNVGALEHPSINQGTQGYLTSAQETLEKLSSNSKDVKVVHDKNGLQTPLSAPMDLEHTLSATEPKELPISASGSLGHSLTIQKIPKHLVPSSLGNLETCQSAKVRLRTLRPSQIVLESAPSMSGSLGDLSSALGNMRISSLANETPEQSQCAEGDVESSPSATGTLGWMAFAQKSLNNFLSGREILETLPPSQEAVENFLSTQGAVELSTSTKGRVENLSPPKRPGKPTSPAGTGALGRSPSSQDTGETASSVQGTIEPSSSAKSVLGIHAPLEQTLSPPQFTLKTPESLQYSPEVYKTSDSIAWIPETLESIKEALISSECALGPIISDQVILGPPTLPQETLDPYTFDQESVKSVPSQMGLLRPSLTDQGFQKMSSSAMSSLRDLPPQQIYGGNSLSTQGDLGLYISAQDSLEHSPSPEGTPNLSISSQVVPEPCLNQEALGISSSGSGDLELSESSQGTLRILPCTQSTLEISSVTHEMTEYSPSAQDSLRLPPPSVQILQPLPLTPEASEPFASTQANCKASKSVSATLETLPSVPGPLGLLKSHEGALGFSISNQGILGTSTPLQETLELCKPTPGPLEPMPSTQETVGPSFSTEFPGLSICPQGDFIPITPHEDCLGNSPYSKISPRISNSTKRMLRCVPFPEGYIRYSLSELNGLKSVGFAKSRLTPSKDVKKDSSSTSTPQRSVSPPTSSELIFISCTPSKEDLRRSPFPSSRGGSSYSNLEKKTRSKHASLDQTGLKSVPSDGGSKVCHSSKKGERASISDKRGARLKTEPSGSFSTFASAKGVSRSSRSHVECLRSPPSPQGIPRWSKSTKTKLKKAPSDQADFQDSHSECKGCKLSSSSESGCRHSSYAKRGQKTKEQESITPSISTEEGVGTTPIHEENLRHSTSPHVTPRHTTSTRRKSRHGPYTRETIQTSPADQEGIKPSPDEDSPHGGVKPCSSPQGNDRHLDSTEEGLKPALSVQGGEKPCAKGEPMVLLPIRWGLIYAPIPKEKAASFLAIQGKVRHTVSLAELRSSLSYQGRDTAFQYEYGEPICNPSVLGGHRYSHLAPCGLKRISLQKGCWSSNLSPKEGIRLSQSDRHGLTLLHSHQRDISNAPTAQGRFRMFHSERKDLLYTQFNNLGLRYTPCDRRVFRIFSSHQEHVRPSTSALGSIQPTPHAQGSIRASGPVKCNL